MSHLNRSRWRLPAGTVALLACAGLIGAADASASAKYVALGDSYSSGDGVTPYASGTGNFGNGCRRSESGAYPVIVAERLGYKVSDPTKFDFAACSGAVSRDLFEPNHDKSEGPQLDHLGRETELVTLTIGGNDLGLSNWIDECMTYAPDRLTWRGWVPGPATTLAGSWGCSANPVLTNATIEGIKGLAGQTGKYLRTTTPSTADPSVGTLRKDKSGQPIGVRGLNEILAAIHARAPFARIFLGGYPKVFGGNRALYERSTYDTVSGYECGLTEGTGMTYDYADATDGGDGLLTSGGWLSGKLGANEIAAAYTDLERSIVSSSNLPVTFVDPQPRFAGHVNCDTGTVDANGNSIESAKWLAGVSTTVTGSFHPTATGQRDGYAEAFLSAIR